MRLGDGRIRTEYISRIKNMMRIATMIRVENANFIKANLVAI